MGTLYQGEQGLFFKSEIAVSARTLRIAVVGSGPAGMYAIQHLLEKRGLAVEIDLFERLPTPWGLVRAGVAPDHPEKKQIIDQLYVFLLSDPKVRFIGNVEVGTDVRAAELAEWYDAVIYAVGATSDMRMGISGEDLAGCWAAREFVGFYNGHPDYSHLKFDLSCDRAIVVGNGNVALDVARILTMPWAELEKTDIADHALETLRGSAIREVVLLGRRGHLQGAFANPELEELEHVDDVDIVIDGEDLPGNNEVVLDGADWASLRKLETLRRLATRRRPHAKKRIVFRFLSSPVELLGNGKVEQVLVVRNHLLRDDRGNLLAQPTDEQSVLPAGLVLRAIGYRGTPFAGLPFDERLGVIRNYQGRVTDEKQTLAGIYVTGWIKRGCRGIIGSNKKCAKETIDCLLEDAAAGLLPSATMTKRSVMGIIRSRKADVVTLGGWTAIDHSERKAGRSRGRPRVKITHTATMLSCASSQDHVVPASEVAR